MDRMIEVKVFGNHLTKDSKNAGTKGEANVTRLRVTFDEGWDGYVKEVVFWDAYGKNAVGIMLTSDRLEDIEKSTRVYICPIPAEAMARAGLMTFAIRGYLDGKKQVSIESKLEVKDSPDILEPVAPTPTQVEQLQVQVEAIIGNIKEATIASKEASESAKNAKKSAEKAETAVGKTSYIGENGNWYAWDGEKDEFYDTGVKAQAGSTVYYGDNPPDEADVWVDPNGIADTYTTAEVDSIADAINGRVDTVEENKADKATTLTGYGITDAYTKEETDGFMSPIYSMLGSLDSGKADKATTLAGYGITDALSKGEAAQGFGAIDERLTNRYYTKGHSDGKFQEKLTSAQLQNISDVAKKADATDVEKLESDVKALGDNKAEMSYVRNQFANALKGTASGEAIGLHDVSPLEHTMSVKVKSKNLIYYPYSPLIESNGVTFTDNGDGTVTVNGTATATITKNLFYTIKAFEVPDGDYTLSGCPEGGTADTFEIRVINITDNLVEISAIGTPVTAHLEAGKKYNVAIVIRKGFAADNLVFKPQLEKGATATTYTPYVADVTNVGVYKYGANLFNKNNYNVGYSVRNTDGTLSRSSTGYGSTDYIPVVGGKTFTVSGYVTDDSTTRHIAYYDKNKAFVSGGNASDVFTAPQNACYIRKSLHEDDVATYQIGTTATEYEPYDFDGLYFAYADGTVDGIYSKYPTTTLISNTEGVVVDCEYNRDINKAFDELMQAINTLGGNV